MQTVKEEAEKLQAEIEGRFPGIHTHITYPSEDRSGYYIIGLYHPDNKFECVATVSSFVAFYKFVDFMRFLGERDTLSMSFGG